MALRARPRKEFTASFNLVYTKDPAVDQTSFANLMKYQQDWDIAVLGDWVEGRTPTIFVCRPLTARQTLAADQQQTDELSWWWAFRYSVENITGIEGDEGWAPDFEETDHGKFLKDRCAFELGQLLGMDVIYQIGKAVLVRAHLAKVEKKGSSLPPGSDRTP